MAAEPVNDSQVVNSCEENCHWRKLFSDSMRDHLQQANFEAGLMTLFFGILVNCTILMSEKLRKDKAYRNLLPYTISTTLRRGVPALMAISPFRCLTNRVCESATMCNTFALIDNFVAVFEIESLAQICIERLINVLYMQRGRKIPDWHNQLFLFISLTLASLYSLMPVVGIGSYNEDFDCVNCTVNVLLPDSDAFQSLAIFFFMLKTIKPVVVMITTLEYVRCAECNKTKIKKDDKKYNSFTSSVNVMVKLNILFWLPIFLVRSSVVISQILFDTSEPQWAPCFMLFAVSMHWIAPVIAMTGFVYYNKRLWSKMKNLLCLRAIDSDEASPPPETIQPEETKVAPIQPEETKVAQEAN